MGTASPSPPRPRWSRRRRLVVVGLAVVAAVAITVPVLTTVVGSETRAAVTRDGVIRGTGGDDVLRGTSGPDEIRGGGGNDRLIGLAGADRLLGGPGNDTLVGGRGSDTLLGDTGDDEIVAEDGQRDTIDCGPGTDRVLSSDPSDRLAGCELVDRELPPRTGSVVLEDEPWICTGPVNLDLVKVTMQTVDTDAIYLRQDCSGWIGRIEVDTYTQDGVKVNAPPPAAHDLVIGGGYIRCHAHTPFAHQDGIQVMGGERIRFRDLEISCSSNPNAQLLIGATGLGLPTDVVCDRCVLGGGAASTLLVGQSVRSGLRDSAACPGRFHTLRFEEGADRPVNARNRVLTSSDERCQTG
jgi:Ca2+-binding RTX toxin-like protein